MTKAQKALREAREAKSKNRQRMAEIGLMAEGDVTDEIRSEQGELEAAVPELERRERAAQVAVDQEEDRQREEGDKAAAAGQDPETRERLELRGKVKIGRFLEAAMETRTVDGAEAEYMAALKLPLTGRGAGGTAFPLELLAPEIRHEERATTDAETVTTPRRWLDRLFAGTAAMNVGVTMESVPAGVASYPVTTAGASAAQRQRATDSAADAAWTIGVTEAKPKRNAVRAVFTIEDAARIPGLESALTRDLRMALTEGIDRAVFLGDTTATGTDADITGLQTASITETTLTQANKVKGPETLTAFTGMVDGISAMGLGDLRVVAAIGAWRLWENTIINSTADNMTLAAFLREAGLSWTARGEIETATANGDFGAFVGLGRGIEGAGVAAVWEAGELIRDPYSKAATGEVAITLCYLWDFVLPRTGNFRRLKFVT